jgi:hypothetical protein
LRTDEVKLHDQFAENLRDPHWLVPRLTIQTKAGKTRSMHPLFEEQIECIDAFQDANAILVEKPRQVGSTTVWVALFFWMMMTCGDSYDVLAVMHEFSSVSRFTRQVRKHIQALPRALRPTVLLESSKEVRIRVGKAESSFCTTMAGGRGQGRSFTFRGALLSEVGRYPRGSSAQGGNQGVDEEVYASIDDTMPKPNVDPLVRQVLESTAGPPVGLFYDLIKHMHGGDPDVAAGWKFLFFPWFKFKQYRMDWPGGDLTPEEKVLLAKYGPEGMTKENIAFRRFLIKVKGRSERMFRQEYPSSWDEPFMLVASLWFDLERIRAMQLKLPKPIGNIGLRVYVPFDPAHMHWLGVDAAGGNEGDNAVITVVRDDAVVCAVWSDNQTSMHEQGTQASRMSAMYGGAQANVEVGNVWGRAVWKRCQDLGVPLWTDDDGRDFVTDKRTKAVVMDWMKQLVAIGALVANDGTLLEECNHVREQKGGGVSADQGYKDDHVMSCALGLWAARATITSGWQSKQRSGKIDEPKTWNLASSREDLEKRMLGGRRGR